MFSWQAAGMEIQQVAIRNQETSVAKDFCLFRGFSSNGPARHTVIAVFTNAEIEAMHDYEENALASVGVREERFERKSGQAEELPAKQNAFRCSLRELLKPVVFEELIRRFS